MIYDVYIYIWYIYIYVWYIYIYDIYIYKIWYMMHIYIWYVINCGRVKTISTGLASYEPSSQYMLLLLTIIKYKYVTYMFWLVVLTILKNISHWKGLSHILWKINKIETTKQWYIYIYISQAEWFGSCTTPYHQNWRQNYTVAIAPAIGDCFIYRSHKSGCW